MNENERALGLTEHGHGLLERHRDGHHDHRQAFYAGADKARERTHDAQLYRAYLKAAERLQAREARILRVELDRELKREYQRFLQERNRGDRDSDGRPDARSRRSRSGRGSVTCRTSTTRSISRTCASSTKSQTATCAGRIWKSRPSTTEVATRRPRPDRDSPFTPAEAAVDGAGHSIPAWLRTSCEPAPTSDELEHRPADGGAHRGRQRLRLHGASADDAEAPSPPRKSLPS